MRSECRKIAGSAPGLGGSAAADASMIDHMGYGDVQIRNAGPDPLTVERVTVDSAAPLGYTLSDPKTLAPGEGMPLDGHRSKMRSDGLSIVYIDAYGRYNDPRDPNPLVQ